MAPPAGLWEGISSEMGLQNGPTPKTAAIMRWYWVAAAVLLALVGFFAIYQYNHSEFLPKVAQSSHSSQTPQVAQVSQTPIMEKETSPENQQMARADVPQYAKAKAIPKLAEETSQPSPAEPIQEAAEESPQPVSEESSQQTSVVASRKNVSSTDNHAVAKHQAKQVTAPNPKDKWSIRISASGGLLAVSNQSRTNRIYLSDKSAVGNDVDGVSYNGQLFSENIPYTIANIVTKHHIPVSLGLSLHYQLNPRLALLTGISYTYLHSEFCIPLLNYHEPQKLHYLGVPVGLSWQLWKRNGFSIYLSGAAQLDKCLNEKPWQFSLSAAAGAEYAITSQFSLYLEPSLGYYFNDGTKLKHYYKEHPFAPSLQLGFRLHLKR